MPRLSKKKKRERLLIAIAIGVAVGILLILGIRVVLFYAPDAMRALFSWLMHLLPSAAVPSFSTTPPPLPLAATSTLSSATYTELFSGVGFDDATDTTVYEDYVATAISLVPDFSVSTTTATFAPAPAIPAPAAPAGVPASENLSGTVTVTASADGNVYTASIPAFPELVVTSSYPGILRFGYDPSTQRTLIIYAAYESRVFEMGPTGAGGQTGLTGLTGMLADYSARFGSRVFAGDAFGSRAVDPVIFSQDGAWWIFSGAGSTKPKLMKIQDGAVIDYTQAAFPKEATLAAAPGPAPHEIYVKGSSGSFVLTDNGFKPAAAQWVSSKLNQWDGNVAQGEITSVEDSAAFDGGDDTVSAAGASASVPAPSYFLSNDGGATWIAVAAGEPLIFPTSGGDFRFKVELSPTGGVTANSYATPWVDIVRLEYWVARSAL